MKSKHPDRVPQYLQHILDAIDRAISYAAGMDFAAFEKDTRTQDAVIRSIEIIGEAATKFAQLILLSRLAFLTFHGK